MESSRQVFLSKKCDKLFRKYTENDNLIALYGLQNYILGGWKTEDLTSFDKFAKYLPENLKVNGFALIYNDNVHEDFDSVIQEKIEKIKNSLSNYFEKNIYIFVLKDMKYNDDLEELNYEKTCMFKLIDISDEIETHIKLDNNLENFNKNFCFLNSDIKLEFYSKENFTEDIQKDTTAISINYECFEKDIREIFSNEKFFVFLENEKFLIDKINNLDQGDVDKITNMLKKLDINNNGKTVIYFFFFNFKINLNFY